jgi:hypothetical protein
MSDKQDEFPPFEGIYSGDRIADRTRGEVRELRAEIKRLRAALKVHHGEPSGRACHDCGLTDA